jgi:hypothetical protein
LFWQQLFQSLHSIRNTQPNCRILGLTEACFSGGAIKFVKDEAISFFNRLEKWPIFLIATAGEAQTSFSGFMTRFLHHAKQATEQASDGTTLLQTFLQASEEYSNVLRRVPSRVGAQRAAIFGCADINHSYSGSSGVENVPIAHWFRNETRRRRPPKPNRHACTTGTSRESSSSSSVARELSTALRVQGKSPLLGSRKCPGKDGYSWASYDVVADSAAYIASGLCCILPRRSSVGIASENRREWIEADFACTFADFMSVGLHVEWSADKLQAIVAQAEIACVIASAAGALQIEKALQLQLQLQLPPREETLEPMRLKLVVLLDADVNDAGAASRRFAPYGVAVRRWADIAAAGKRAGKTHTGFGFRHSDVSNFDADDDGDQPFTLMFSSGSTGHEPEPGPEPEPEP